MNNKIKISDMLKDIETNCSKIVNFCAIHMLEKDFDIENDYITIEQRDDFFMNYTKYNRYLNDYAGVIYNQFESSIDEVYYALCDYFKLNSDNNYLYEFRLNKLQKNQPARIMNIEDDDMKELALQRIEEKVEEIATSNYYLENSESVNKDLEPIVKNIELLKKALQISK